MRGAAYKAICRRRGSCIGQHGEGDKGATYGSRDELGCIIRQHGGREGVA